MNDDLGDRSATTQGRRRPGILLMLMVLPWTFTAGVSRAQQWRAITPVAGEAPAPRANAAAIYDPIARRVVVFGGRGAGGALNDVWAYDLDTERWANLTPDDGAAPAPRFTPATVYDAVGRQMVTWSGQGNGFFNDVWTFDLDDPSWAERHPGAPIPNTRYGVAAVFDPRMRALVTFAGFTDQGRFNDVWRFDVANDTWQDVTPAAGPIKRCLHTAGYDARDHRMLVYGGQQSGPLDDLWAFDLATDTWTDLTPDVRPPGRLFAASAYDVRRHRLIVFGGNRGAAGVTDEVWAFDLDAGTWSLLAPTGDTPAPREGAVAVYVEDEHRIIVFGGRADGYFGDVWSLDLQRTGTAVEPHGAPTIPFRLLPTYPNPFTDQTTIGYELPQPATIELAVHDVLGRRVRTLAHRTEPAGRHEVTWDGARTDGRRLPPGVYLVVLRAGTVTASRRMVLGT